MDKKNKKLEIQRFQKRLKAEMPRVIKEIENYENALKRGGLNKSPTPSPQFSIG